MRILASIFIIPMTFLLFQPLLSNNYARETVKGCHSTKCHKDKQKKAAWKCENCNPFMACILCNYFTDAKNVIEIKATVPDIQKIFVINDNRLAFHSSDCWHPPEFV